MFLNTYEFLAAYILDLLFGDPEGWPHPVRLIGRIVTFLEPHLNNHNLSGNMQKAAGAVLLVTTTGITMLITAAIVSYSINPLHTAVTIYIAYTAIAATSLNLEAGRMVKKLDGDDIVTARVALSRIVGRDTENMSKEDIIRATIETVSENLSDGVIAPMLYLAVAGPVGAMAYKSVNTLDSMVGYKNEKYKHIGWASAKMDDLLNLIPARLCVLLISASFLLCNGVDRAKAAAQTGWADGSKSDSPNAGYPEAAMAGGLGVMLGGDDYQHGVKRHRPEIGAGGKEPEIRDIKTTILIARTASIILMLAILTACL